MKKLLAVLLFLSANAWAQDQVVELCERSIKTFQYKAVGSPNCQWRWNLFFNGVLKTVEHDEELQVKFETPGNYHIELQIENELCESDVQDYDVLVIECRRPIVLVPTAFTPNRSGLNDVFRVRVSHIQQIKIQIFNRWGTLFFVSTDPEIGWDGTLAGMAAPEGAYICLVEYQDVFGNFGQEVSSLTLYR